MQNDDFTEPLGPLTKHENGSLNLRSSCIDGQTVKRSSPQSLALFIPKRDRRIVNETLPLQKGDTL